MVSADKKAKGRPANSQTRQRVTITLPAATLQRVRQRVTAVGATSLSAYIAELLEESERSSEVYWQYLAARFREQPITEKERQWIASLFDR